MCTSKMLQKKLYRIYIELVQGNDEKYFRTWTEITHFSVIYTFSILPLQDSKLKQKGFKDHFSVLIYTVSYSQ